MHEYVIETAKMYYYNLLMLTLFTNKTFRWCGGRRLVPAQSWPEVLVAAATRLIIYPNIISADISLIAGTNFLCRTGWDIDLIDPDLLFSSLAEFFGLMTIGYVSIYPVVIAWCIHSWSRERLRILSSRDSTTTE